MRAHATPAFVEEGEGMETGWCSMKTTKKGVSSSLELAGALQGPVGKAASNINLKN